MLSSACLEQKSRFLVAAMPNDGYFSHPGWSRLLPSTLRTPSMAPVEKSSRSLLPIGFSTIVFMRPGSQAQGQGPSQRSGLFVAATYFFNTNRRDSHRAQNILVEHKLGRVLHIWMDGKICVPDAWPGERQLRHGSPILLRKARIP